MSQIPITDTYESVYPLLRKLCFDHKKRFPKSDVDELMGWANQAYMYAYRGHQADKGKFTTYLVHCVNNAFTRQWSLSIRQIPTNSLTVEPLAPTSAFSCEAFLADLSTDAQTLVRLLWSGGIPQQKSVTPKFSANVKKAIKRYAKTQGWEYPKVEQCFQEIAEALT